MKISGKITQNNVESSKPKDRSKTSSRVYAVLWREFLKFSPTYELACKSRSGLLSRAEKKLLPEDFDLVLATYDQFGDIYKTSFDDWWKEKGCYLLGSALPKVTQIGFVEKNEPFDSMFQKSFERYFNVVRVNQGGAPSLILGIPLEVTKRSLFKQISQMIDRTKVKPRKKYERAPKAFAAKRLRFIPLVKKLYLLALKINNPKLELWRMGVIAQISPSNMKGLDAHAKTKTQNTKSARDSMGALTSRYLLSARHIAENAARGEFPSAKNIDLPSIELIKSSHEHQEHIFKLARSVLQPLSSDRDLSTDSQQ